MIRVTDALTLQLAPWTTPGGEHLAFAMTRSDFEDVFSRARGPGKALYLFDPSKHLIEIRYYES